MSSDCCDATVRDALESDRQAIENGRGGFMAVLHPNETVIDHMKAGSGNTWTGGQSSNAVTIGNIVLPGVTNEREGRRAAATVGREINRVVAGSARYA